MPGQTLSAYSTRFSGATELDSSDYTAKLEDAISGQEFLHQRAG